MGSMVEIVSVVGHMRRTTPSSRIRIVDLGRVDNSIAPRLSPGNTGGWSRSGGWICWYHIEMFSVSSRLIANFLPPSPTLPIKKKIKPLTTHTHTHTKKILTNFLRLLSSITHLMPSIVQFEQVTSPSGVT
jgi:hypothetical protein